MRDIYREDEEARRWLLENGTHWQGQTEVRLGNDGVIKLESVLADYIYDRALRNRIKVWVKRFLERTF